MVKQQSIISTWSSVECKENHHLRPFCSFTTDYLFEYDFSLNTLSQYLTHLGRCFGVLYALYFDPIGCPQLLNFINHKRNQLATKDNKIEGIKINKNLGFPAQNEPVECAFLKKNYMYDAHSIQRRCHVGSR